MSKSRKNTNMLENTSYDLKHMMEYIFVQIKYLLMLYEPLTKRNLYE